MTRASIAKMLSTHPCISSSLQWRHNEHDGVSNHWCLDCLLNHLFGCWSKKASKLRVTGLCEGNSPVTSEFPSQRASNVEMPPFDNIIMCLWATIRGCLCVTQAAEVIAHYDLSTNFVCMTCDHGNVSLHLGSSPNEFSWDCRFPDGVSIVLNLLYDLF